MNRLGPLADCYMENQSIDRYRNPLYDDGLCAALVERNTSSAERIMNRDSNEIWRASTIQPNPTQPKHYYSSSTRHEESDRKLFPFFCFL